MDTLTLVLVGLSFPAGIIYASFFEWTLHRYLMHRPFGKFTYAYRAHAIVHHGTFRADSTYTIGGHPQEKWDEDIRTIPMAWWNGPVLVVVATLPFVLWSLWNPSWTVVVLIATALAVYYGVYEYLHWCMHDPKDRWFERTHWFCWVNAHHLLHHRHTGKNFNVVLPLADLCLGTLVFK